jgi:transposase
MRDLVRARLDAVRAPRQQLSGFLLRQGCHYGRPAWTKLLRRWLAGLKFEQAVHHIVLEDYLAAVEAAEARRDRLTAQIEAMLPDWTLAPVVAALQTMRGMALVNAATLVAELGDLSRFANPRQLMAYLACQQSCPRRSAQLRRLYRSSHDSSLEGDGFEHLVPRHKSRGFPQHSGHGGRIDGALKRYRLIVQPFFFCASNHSIEPSWGTV